MPKGIQGFQKGHKCFFTEKSKRFKKGNIPWNKGKKGNIPWNKGKKCAPLTEKHKRKISENSARYFLGKSLTKEHKNNISKGRKGIIAWNKGIPSSEESKEKSRLSHLGNTPTEKSRKKMSKSHKNFYANGGIPWMLGRHHSKEAKKRKSESAKRSGVGKWMQGRHIPKSVRLKISKANKGENSYLWKGGITPLFHQIRTSIECREWKRKVFKRDNYTCQKCGENKKHNFNAHHINGFLNIIIKNNIKTIEQALKCEELWDISNGITFCEKCHQKEFHKRYGNRNNTKEQLDEFLGHNIPTKLRKSL